MRTMVNRIAAGLRNIDKRYPQPFALAVTENPLLSTTVCGLPIYTIAAIPQQPSDSSCPWVLLFNLDEYKDCYNLCSQAAFIEGYEDCLSALDKEEK